MGEGAGGGEEGVKWDSPGEEDQLENESEEGERDGNTILRACKLPLLV